MIRTRLAVLALAAVLAALALMPAGASAAKVANPGSFSARVVDGMIRIKQQTFTFDENSGIVFNGTVQANGTVAVPPSGVVFPSFPLSAGGQDLTVSIRPANTTSGGLQPISGFINPMNGEASLRLRVWIKIDGVPFGGGCRIGSADSPIDVNALVTGTLPPVPPNGSVTGTPYNLSNALLTVVNNNFSVPSSSDCGLAAGTVNGELGLPSGSGNNEARFTLRTTPTLQRAIVPSFTTTPSSGEAPLNVDFNAGGSFSSRPVASYQWDFTNNGSVDATGQTTNFTYTNPGTYTARLRVTDIDGDFADTTRTITVNVAPPDYAINKSHAGNFRVGSPGVYTLQVDGQRGPNTGPITVTDTLPTGLTYQSATGTGWSCGATGQNVTCTFNGTLAAGADPPAITLTVGVTAAARPSVINTASVSTPGDADASDNSDSDSTTVTATDLTIDKSHDQTTQDQFGNFYAGPGNDYLIEVENIGDAATVGTTTVTDTLPEGLTYESASGAGWTCSAVGQEVTCTRAASIPAGAAAPPITLTVTASVPLLGGSRTVTNTATVSTADDVDGSNNSDSDETLILDSPDAAIDKESSTETFTAADQGSYTITVQNRGPKTTTGPTTVTDTLPAGLTYVSGTGTGWVCQDAGQDVTCVYALPLAPGETAPVITLTVEVGVEAIPEVSNTATVSTLGDENPANDSDTETTEVRQIDLTITKEQVGVFRVDRNAEYLLTVTNSGNSATAGETTVTDTLPAGATFVSATGEGWECSNAGQNVTCVFAGPISGGGSSAPPISLVVALDGAAVPEITNSASVATDDDLNPDNDSTTHTAQVIEQDAAIDKSRSGTFAIGSTGTYVLSVDNVGTRATTGPTTVTDELPAGLTYVSASGSGWSCGAAGQTVTCTRNAVIAANSATPDISIQVMVGEDVPGNLSNTATVSTPGDRNAANDSDTDQTTVSRPDLTIDKSHAGNFSAGGTGTYTLAVSNTGSLATNSEVIVTDLLPEAFTYVGATGSGWDCAAGNQLVTCSTNAAIPAAGSAPPITLQVSVVEDAPASVTNSADVAMEGEQNISNNADSDPTTINRVDAGIDFDGPTAINVGDDAVYTATVSNDGSSQISSAVTLTASFETGVVPVEGNGPGWSCNVTGQDVSCTSGDDLAVGAASSEISFRTHVTADADGEVTHTATVDTSGDFTSGNDSDTVTSSVSRFPDLELAISSLNSAGYQVGEDGAYRLTVRNDGGVATDDQTAISLTLPNGFTVPGAFTGDGDWNCNVAGQIVTCSTGEALQPQTNSSVDVPVEVGPSAPGSATANATATNADDPDASDNQASTTDPVTRVDVGVSQFPGGSFRVGDQGTIEFEVTNSGSAATSGPTVVTDELPAGFAYAGATGDGWNCGASLQTVTCERTDPIAASASAPTITLTVDVFEGAALFTTNVVEVSTLHDANPGNDSDSEMILVAPKPTTPPPADPVDRPVQIQNKKATPTRSGFLTLFLACPANSEKRCQGTLTVRSAGKIRVVPGKGRKRRILVGTASYDIAAGRRFPVTMKLTNAAATALRFRRSLKSVATADATTEGVATTTKPVLIRSRTRR